MYDLLNLRAKRSALILSKHWGLFCYHINTLFFWLRQNAKIINKIDVNSPINDSFTNIRINMTIYVKMFEKRRFSLFFPMAISLGQTLRQIPCSCHIWLRHLLFLIISHKLKLQKARVTLNITIAMNKYIYAHILCYCLKPK